MRTLKKTVATIILFIVGSFGYTAIGYSGLGYSRGLSIALTILIVYITIEIWKKRDF